MEDIPNSLLPKRRYGCLEEAIIKMFFSARPFRSSSKRASVSSSKIAVTPAYSSLLAVYCNG